MNQFMSVHTKTKRKVRMSEDSNLFKLTILDCSSNIVYTTLDEIMVLPDV